MMKISAILFLNLCGVGEKKNQHMSPFEIVLWILIIANVF